MWEDGRGDIIWVIWLGYIGRICEIVDLIMHQQHRYVNPSSICSLGIWPKEHRWLHHIQQKYQNLLEDLWQCFYKMIRWPIWQSMFWYPQCNHLWCDNHQDQLLGSREYLKKGHETEKYDVNNKVEANGWAIPTCHEKVAKLTDMHR